MAKKLSQELERYFFQEERQTYVKLGDIFSLAGERLFGFLFVILALPSALPIPAPGYSIPFGILIFLLAIQLVAGRQRPWLPTKMMNRSMTISQAQGFVKAGIPWLKRIEAIARPRMSYLCASFPGRVIIGIAIALMSISMMIPIPLTNTLPAIGIFVTGFGLLEDDGAISLGGLIVCLLGGILTCLILILGLEVVEAFLDFLKNWLGSIIS
ncbi:exopolysaccharide biosynthesis protein [Oscillatoria salina]|uniref:exopolysaccharide biosynthesis protein n=1 Tax=Oscillatoria salina TaxID=331517 RepID=UPI0013BCAD09|nr:exopolysaccharide biosynthesis protein [Oscillatoria salina]MBZ8182372.1 exopolysaccharide biosynthesis protein [Oscillatoria salina IIICB1]NET90159.1 exopolysaccharide biosynthesis protein [Kamptonema sp. SIO1D9]